MITRSRKWLIVGAMLVVATMAYAGPSSAHNFSGNTGNRSSCSSGFTGGLNMADPNPHSFFYADLDVMSPAQANTRLDDYDPTTVNTTYENPWTIDTDVLGYEADYVTYCGVDWDGPKFNVYGLATCVSIIGNGKCEQHEIRYDTPDAENMSTTLRYALACHETGHTLGLMHRRADASCMHRTLIASEDLSDHDRNHLNSRY